MPSTVAEQSWVNRGEAVRAGNETSGWVQRPASHSTLVGLHPLTADVTLVDDRIRRVTECTWLASLDEE